MDLLPNIPNVKENSGNIGTLYVSKIFQVNN